VRTTISTKGQIVLPAELRAADGIKAGEEFEVDRVGPDEYRLTRLTPPPNRDLVEWLRSCPEDGWFVEIESESTASTGLRWAELLARLRGEGRAMPIKDSLIASTALAHGLTVVTLNRRDFDAAGVVIVDPVAESGR